MEMSAAPGTDAGDFLLVVRLELVDSEPAVWRQLEIRGSLAPHQVP